jgi:hypothetical protein
MFEDGKAVSPYFRSGKQEFVTISSSWIAHALQSSE